MHQCPGEILGLISQNLKWKQRFRCLRVSKAWRKHGSRFIVDAIARSAQIAICLMPGNCSDVRITHENEYAVFRSQGRPTSSTLRFDPEPESYNLFAFDRCCSCVWVAWQFYEPAFLCDEVQLYEGYAMEIPCRKESDEELADEDPRDGADDGKENQVHTWEGVWLEVTLPSDSDEDGTFDVEVTQFAPSFANVYQSDCYPESLRLFLCRNFLFRGREDICDQLILAVEPKFVRFYAGAWHKELARVGMEVGECIQSIEGFRLARNEVHSAVGRIQDQSPLLVVESDISSVPYERLIPQSDRAVVRDRLLSDLKAIQSFYAGLSSHLLTEHEMLRALHSYPIALYWRSVFALETDRAAREHVEQALTRALACQARGGGTSG